MTQRWHPNTKAGPNGPTPQKAKSKSAPKEEQPAPDTTAVINTHSAPEPWEAIAAAAMNAWDGGAAHLIAQRESVPPTDTYLDLRKQLFPRPTDKD